MTVSNNAPDDFVFGANTVIFTATDSGGQTSTATATVTVDWSISVPNDLTGNGPDGNLSAAADNVTVKGSYTIPSGALTFIRPPTRGEALPTSEWGGGSRGPEVSTGTNLFYRPMTHVRAANWCAGKNGRLATDLEVETHILGAGGILGPNSNGYWESTLKWVQTPSGKQGTHYWTSSPPSGQPNNTTKRRVMLTKSTAGVAQYLVQAQLMTRGHLPLCVGDN